jgi:hypothetical protein
MDLGTQLDMSGHKRGPGQDQKARLVVAGHAHAAGFSVGEIAELLDALALLPGQETTRQVAGPGLRGETNPTCIPKTPGWARG